jgi:hypothetical protein
MLLESAGDAQHSIVAAARADDLQTNGKAGA